MKPTDISNEVIFGFYQISLAWCRNCAKLTLIIYEQKKGRPRYHNVAALCLTIKLVDMCN